MTSIFTFKRTKPRFSGAASRFVVTDKQEGTVSPNGGTVEYTWDYSELNPGDTQPHPYVLTPQDVAAIKTNNLFLFIYGDTHCTDIFGQEHETTWCWYDPNPPSEPGVRQANVWNEVH